jgi:DNA-nicking Smr family endonuclease
MARRQKTPDPGDAGDAAAGRSPFHAPFATLRIAIRDVPISPPATNPAATPRPPACAVETPARSDGPELEDDASFAEAMRGVVPLPLADRLRMDGPPPAGPGFRPPLTDDAEALAILGDLVAGNGPLDITDTDEYIEGRAAGVDPRIVRRLRRGDFAYQAHLDLHQLTTEEARGAVEQLLVQACRRGLRCVLIIHGRGRNSKDQIPVLKERLKVWLGRGALSRAVLAFTTARPCDGGAGALYVLLRRTRRERVPFIVTGGAKR